MCDKIVCVKGQMCGGPERYGGASENFSSNLLLEKVFDLNSPPRHMHTPPATA